MDKLEEVEWFIINGCEKGDREGDWTYSEGRRESVLNYVIGDREVWDRIERIKVEERVDSDHFPVVVWMKGEDEGLKRGGG